jgi:hypothetical protein
MRIGRVGRRWSAWMPAGSPADVRDPFRVVVMN